MCVSISRWHFREVVCTVSLLMLSAFASAVMKYRGQGSLQGLDGFGSWLSRLGTPRKYHRRQVGIWSVFLHDSMVESVTCVSPYKATNAVIILTHNLILVTLQRPHLQIASSYKFGVKWPMCKHFSPMHICVCVCVGIHACACMFTCVCIHVDAQRRCGESYLIEPHFIHWGKVFHLNTEFASLLCGSLFSAFQMLESRRPCHSHLAFPWLLGYLN